MTRHHPVPIGFCSLEEAARFMEDMRREDRGRIKPRASDDTKPLSGYEGACHPRGNGE